MTLQELLWKYTLELYFGFCTTSHTPPRRESGGPYRQSRRGGVLPVRNDRLSSRGVFITQPTARRGVVQRGPPPRAAAVMWSLTGNCGPLISDRYEGAHDEVEYCRLLSRRELRQWILEFVGCICDFETRWLGGVLPQ